MLTVNEIFHSVQGESTRAGVRCVFVRLTACDLRCSWCDTPYAFHEGRKMSIQEVMDTVASYECPTVELTGGEPLLQKDVYPLMTALLDTGHTVLIETGGHVNIGQVPDRVIKIVDVKCPGSGEAHRMDWDNLSRLAAARAGDAACRVRISFNLSSSLKNQPITATSATKSWAWRTARGSCTCPTT